MKKKTFPFWIVSPHVYILGAGASRAAFPNGDRNGKKLPLMNDFIETLELSPLLQKAGVNPVGANIEDVYSRLFVSGNGGNLLQELNERIVAYFSQLTLPDEVTLYDELLISLQKKDAIFSFNWDPLLLQAYSRNHVVDQLPSIHFLHGNVAIGVCSEDRHVGFVERNCSICGKPFAPSQLLFPIGQKDYHTDPFIHSEWEALKFYLDNAFILTLFGYSAPNTDIEAKEMMMNAWIKNARTDLNEFQLIDIRNRDELEESWAAFKPKDHYGIFDNVHDTLSFRYARRSCNAWGDAIMQCNPWSEMLIPRFTNLRELQLWARPLVEQEIEFEKNDVPPKQYKRDSPPSQALKLTE